MSWNPSTTKPNQTEPTQHQALAALTSAGDAAIGHAEARCLEWLPAHALQALAPRNTGAVTTTTDEGGERATVEVEAPMEKEIVAGEGWEGQEVVAEAGDGGGGRGLESKKKKRKKKQRHGGRGAGAMET
jgi:hypothetical protein